MASIHGRADISRPYSDFVSYVIGRFQTTKYIRITKMVNEYVGYRGGPLEEHAEMHLRKLHAIARPMLQILHKKNAAFRFSNRSYAIENSQVNADIINEYRGIMERRNVI